MDKPIRKDEINDGGFGAPDYDYVESVLDYYQKNKLNIDLKDFTYSEIQSNPELYDVYIKMIRRK